MRKAEVGIERREKELPSRGILLLCIFARMVWRALYFIALEVSDHVLGLSLLFFLKNEAKMIW